MILTLLQHTQKSFGNKKQLQSFETFYINAVSALSLGIGQNSNSVFSLNICRHLLYLQAKMSLLQIIGLLFSLFDSPPFFIFFQREFLLKMDAISVMVGFYLGTKASELVCIPFTQ